MLLVLEGRLTLDDHALCLASSRAVVCCADISSRDVIEMMMITQYFGEPSPRRQYEQAQASCCPSITRHHLLMLPPTFLQSLRTLTFTRITRNLLAILSVASLTSAFPSSDMLKDIGMNTSGGAIFLPHSPGNVADVSAEVPPFACVAV